MTRPSVIPAIVADVIANPVDDCVPAPKVAGRHGYVQFWLNGTQLLVHRYAYEQAHGPIPAGLQIDHLCHDPATCDGDPCPHRKCLNPRHLAAVTPRANVLRGGTIVAVLARATHCVNGHLFDDANTYRRSNGRACRTCRAAASTRYQQRRKQAS